MASLTKRLPLPLGPSRRLSPQGRFSIPWESSRKRSIASVLEALDLIFFLESTTYIPVTGWKVIFHSSGFRLSEAAITATSVWGIETPSSIGGILTHVNLIPTLQGRRLLRQRKFFEEKPLLFLAPERLSDYHARIDTISSTNPHFFIQLFRVSSTDRFTPVHSRNILASYL